MRWRRTRHRPDSLWSWFVCFCASVSGAVHLGFSISFGVLLPELMNEFKESRQNTGGQEIHRDSFDKLLNVVVTW